MSQTVSLASGTRFKNRAGKFVQLAGAVSCIFPDALTLDDVAEILLASAKEDPTMASNLVLNTAVLNRQIVATAALEGGYAAGTALDITYGPNGEKTYTSVGVPPLLIPATTTVEDAADTVIVANFDGNLNSVLTDYKTGFSAKVAGVARVISTAVRQADHKQVKFTLASAVTPGQAVLLSFDSSLSDVKSDAGAKLQSFTDSVVINNVV